MTPQHCPEVERCGTAEEEEVVVKEKEEEGVEEVEEVVEERSLLGEDVQMSSPDRSALEGKFSYY